MAAKKIANSVFIGMILFLIILLFPSQTTSSDNINFSDNKYPSVFNLTEKDKGWIESKINEMTLYEKCAQLIMPAVYRNDLEPGSSGYNKIISLVKEKKVGGLILYQGALVEQAKFINDVQKISDIPLLIASDFERGLGTRIDDATEFPHAMAVGSANDVAYAFEMGKAISIESRLIGVHWNFAPVADINNNPLNPIINIRAFSENKYEVADYVEAFIEGAKEERTLTTVKHFPGHGNTTIDSHLDLPKINGSKDFLIKNELYPFIKAIDSKVHSVMLGHLNVPSLEAIKGIPSSLSESIVNHLLKRELGFDGLIITDAMIMEAITKDYSTEEAAVLAVMAGNDVILMPPDEETAITALNLAVYSGKISIERINESVRKILAAKRWLKIEENKYSDIENIEQQLNIKEHINIAKQIAENSITLLKNDGDILPLHLNEYKNIYCVTLTDQLGSEKASYFQNIFEDRVGNVKSELFTKTSKRRDYNYLLKEIKNESADLIILSTFLDIKTYQGPINLAAEQTDFIAGVLRSGVPTVLLSFKNPYLLYLFPESTTYLNAFSHSGVSQKAMLRAILGEIDINGTLPITIPQSGIAFREGIKLKKSLITTIDKSAESRINTVLFEQKIKSLLNEHHFPGISIYVGSNNKILYKNSVGNSVIDGHSKKLIEGEIFRLGSLTGFIATMQAVMMLVDEKKISLDERAYYYLPLLNDEEKRNITIEHLLTHKSGFADNINNLNSSWVEDKLVDELLKQNLINSPGAEQRYSIINFIVLQKIIEFISGNKMDMFLSEQFYSPIGMKQTYFRSKSDSLNLGFNSVDYQQSIYTSPKDADDVILEIMNGVSGFNGLYSTTSDLATFAQMLLQKGYYDDTQYLKTKTLANWLSIKNEIIPKSKRTKPYTTMYNGDEVSSPRDGFLFIDSYGSAMMIDIEKQIFLIVLSNPGIRNPDNQSFVELFNNLNEFVSIITE